MMQLNYRLRRSAKAKVARIVVSADKIEVVAPHKMSQRQIDQFVAAKQAWATATQAKIRHKIDAISPFSPSNYRHGALVPYQGRHYPLELKPTTTTRKSLKIAFNNAFIVSIPDSIQGDDQHESIKFALSNWMKKAIKTQINQYIEQHAQRAQLIPSAVRVKTQKTRWGSCSNKNAININWLLLLAPPAILEYVVVHELCHIRQKNHSAAFWQLVAEHLPDYQQHRLWLKQHGASLMRGL